MYNVSNMLNLFNMYNMSYVSNMPLSDLYSKSILTVNLTARDAIASKKSPSDQKKATYTTAD